MLSEANKKESCAQRQKKKEKKEEEAFLQTNSSQSPYSGQQTNQEWRFDLMVVLFSSLEQEMVGSDQAPSRNQQKLSRFFLNSEAGLLLFMFRHLAFCAFACSLFFFFFLVVSLISPCA